MNARNCEAVALSEMEWAEFMDEFPGFDAISDRRRWKVDGFYVVLFASNQWNLFHSADWDQAMKYQCQRLPTDI